MKSPLTALRYAALIIAGVVMLVPFLWMVSTSLKTPDALISVPPSFVPSPAQWNNYSTVADRMPIWLFFFNSVKITLLGTFGELLCATLAAYAFARMEFRGKKWIYGALLASMMIPFQVTMIPVFMVMRTLGWLDSQTSLILPHFFGGAFASAAFGIFLLREFFESLPKEFEDAARIDGAGSLRILLQIVLPLSKPVLAVLALFVFMGIWNDLLGPVLFLSSEEQMPLTYGLAMLQSASHMNRYDLLMAGTVISTIPVILFYLATQRHLTTAFFKSGIKG